MTPFDYVDRVDTYSPEEMDEEYVMWDCDNVSGGDILDEWDDEE
jgi:hypothetical protein